MYCFVFPGRIFVETKPIKAEQGPQDGGVAYMEIDIGLQDVKKECLEHSEIISETPGKPIFVCVNPFLIFCFR